MSTICSILFCDSVCVHSVGAFESSQSSINLANKWRRSYCSHLQELFSVGQKCPAEEVQSLVFTSMSSFDLSLST